MKIGFYIQKWDQMDDDDVSQSKWNSMENWAIIA